MIHNCFKIVLLYTLLVFASGPVNSQQEFKLNAQGEVEMSYKGSHRVIQKYTLPQSLRQLVLKNFPQVNFVRNKNNFELCIAKKSGYVLREFNQSLVIINEFSCQIEG